MVLRPSLIANHVSLHLLLKLDDNTFVNIFKINDHEGLLNILRTDLCYRWYDRNITEHTTVAFKNVLEDLFVVRTRHKETGRTIGIEYVLQSAGDVVYDSHVL